MQLLLEGLLLFCPQSKKRHINCMTYMTYTTYTAYMTYMTYMTHMTYTAYMTYTTYGFPEMLTYLLRKPVEDASHNFAHVLVHPLLRTVFFFVKEALAKVSPVHFVPGDISSRMVLHTRPSLKPADYSFRNRGLELMPLYFFLSSCEVSMHLGPNSLSWEELRHEGEVLRQGSYEHQPVCSTDVHELPLLHADGQPIHKF